jgi:predicted O-linked N-acetylglucosamine transferase (SPINDLY family)
VSPGELEGGVAALHAGRHADALAAAVQALRADPGNIQAHRLRANAATGMRAWDQAIDSVRFLLAREPANATLQRVLAGALNNRGSQRAAVGEHASALADFEAVVAIEPEHLQAHFNAAVSLQALRRPEEALSRMETHLRLVPDDHPAALLRTEWLLPLDPGAAAAAFRQLPGTDTFEPALAPRVAILAARVGGAETCLVALQRSPAEHRIEAGLEAASILHLRGDAEGGDRLYAATLLRSRDGRDAPGLRAQLGAALGLSPMVLDTPDIDAQRARFASGLDRLEAVWTPAFLASCEPTLEQLRWSNFFLAYHGRDDRTLQERYARLVTRAVHALAPAHAEPPPRPVPGRIAMVSSFFRDSTVGAYFGCWVRWLAEAGFAVHLYQLGPRRDALTDELAGFCERFHFCEGGIDTIATQIRADRPALAIFPEFGMDSRVPPLAAARMAPCQLAGWGHPITSGMASIDGWFTCAGMEPPDASAHYSETLLRLPGIGVDYRRPPLPPVLGRRSLGLPEDRVLVLVPQAPFKLHPENDAILAAVAAQRPDLRFVMFAGEVPQWRQQLQQRLGRAFTARGRDAATMICWQPLTSRQRYLQINRACDLMLDSLHWSGGNTTLDALLCSLPVLTLPGRYMRGRQSAWMLERAGAQALVCSDESQLVSRTVELVDDAGRRREQAAAIGDASAALFDADEARSVFLHHVESMLGGMSGHASDP